LRAVTPGPASGAIQADPFDPIDLHHARVMDCDVHLSEPQGADDLAYRPDDVVNDRLVLILLSTHLAQPT
jgi:hypothetical protein